MSLPDLLASFASAFNQEQRLLSLQLGDGSRWGEALSDAMKLTADMDVNINLRIHTSQATPLVAELVWDAIQPEQEKH